MSGGFSLFPEMANGFSVGINTASIGAGTVVQAGTGAANTKGSWVPLIASTSNDATWMWLRAIGDNSIDIGVNNILVDIGIGPAASEVVIIPNIHVNAFQGWTNDSFIFPVSIPAGTRIAARAQADGTATNSCYVSMQLFDSGYASPIEGAGVDDLGTNTSNSQLTSVTTGVSGAKGSYVPLVASTAKDYAGLVIGFSNHSATGTTFIDIAVGAGGSEQIIIPDLLLWSSTGGGNPSGWTSVPFFTQVPAGTRISARASTSAGSSLTAFQLAAYGIYQ